ncbi:MAG: hypothetical protein CMJ58_05035 [Planctomycetaceae bacterium]|nr:hypothetical protein [Planctomycetaceae bacterium]
MNLNKFGTRRANRPADRRAQSMAEQQRFWRQLQTHSATPLGDIQMMRGRRNLTMPKSRVD